MVRQALRGGDVASRIRDVNRWARVGRASTSVFAPPLGVCVLPPNLNMGARRPAAAWAVADRSEIRHRGTKYVAGSCNVSHTTILQNTNLRDTMHQTHPVLLFLSRSFLSLSPRLDGGW